jgi:threonine dehydrogenase-like Zn-dependent dehydrogenase
MKALCSHGTSDVRVDTVPDPKIENPRDAIVRVGPHAQDRPDSHAPLPPQAAGQNRRGRNRSLAHHHHRAKLADAPALYKKFRDKEDGCIKVVLRP